RGEKRERRQDHLVAGSDVECVQREQQGIRSRRAADAVARAAIARHLLLELDDLRPLNDLPRTKDAHDRVLQLRLQLAKLGLQVTQRYPWGLVHADSLPLFCGAHPCGLWDDTGYRVRKSRPV